MGVLLANGTNAGDDENLARTPEVMLRQGKDSKGCLDPSVHSEVIEATHSDSSPHRTPARSRITNSRPATTRAIRS